MTDRPTNQPTNQQLDMKVHREVVLPLYITSKYSRKVAETEENQIVGRIEGLEDGQRADIHKE